MSSTARSAETEPDIEPLEVTSEEVYAVFDQSSRRLLGISGDEFLRRWEAGEYDGDEERVIRLVVLIPDGR